MLSTRTTPGEPGEAVESMTKLEELEYIVNTVLGKGGKEHAILLSCIHHGLDNVLDLLCYGDVKGMKYMDKEGTIVPLQSSHIGLIIQFKEFIAPKKRPGVTLKWTDFNPDEFSAYRGNAFRQGNQTAAMTANGDMYDQFDAKCKEERINKAEPKCFATCPESTVHTLHPMVVMPDSSAHSTYARITCAEVTGGEIESPKCNSGETSNTHTMTGSPKFNHGETDKEQTPHGSAQEIVPVIVYNISHNLSLTTVNTCEVKYSSNDSTAYSHNAMICDDNDTFNKDIKAINPTKVNIATTKLADDDPVQHTRILEIDCNGTLVDPLVVLSVNKETSQVLEHIIDWVTSWTYGDVIGSTGVELATNKIADDDPLQSTLKIENNGPICVVAVCANPVKVNVVTHVLADDDPVTLTSELADTTADIDPVKANVEINKLADNDPLHQTGTLKKTQFNALDGKVIFQLLKSKNGESSATAVKNAAAISDSLQRSYVSPSTVDLTDDDPAFIIDSCCQGTKQNICFREWGVVHLVPSDYNNNDRLSLAMALIDTLADNDPYINLHIITPLMLLQGNTSYMMSEEMGSFGPKNGAG